MRGTNQPRPRCVALQGPLGGPTTCVIYARRPSTCRNFGLRWEAGALHASPQQLADCNQARTLCSLPPLEI